MEELNFKLFYGFLNSIKSFLWIGLIIDETTDSSIKKVHAIQTIFLSG